MANYTQKALRGMGTIFVMSIFGSLLSYLIIIFLARKLGPADYGLFQAVFSFVLFFLFFRDLGLPQALTKHIAEYVVQKDYNRIKTAIVSVLSFQMLSSLIFGIAFFLLAGFLAEHYFKHEAAALMLKLLLVYIVASVFFGLGKDILLGFQDMFLFSLSEVLKGAAVLGIALLLLSQGYGVYAPIIGYTAGMLLVFLIYIPSLMRRVPFAESKLTGFSQISKKLVLFGIPVFATAFGSKVITYMDTLMLTHFRQLSEVGVYNAVLPSSSLFSHFIAGAVASAIFPLSTELWYKNDKGRLREGVRLMYTYLPLAIVPIAVIIIAYAPLAIQLLFGAEYMSGVTAFRILLAGMSFFVIAGINHNLLAGIGKPGEVTKIIFIAAALNFLLNLLLIPHRGITGAATATAVSYIVALFLSTRAVAKYVGLHLPLWNWAKHVFLALLLIALALAAQQFLHLPQWWEIVIISGLLLVLYICAAYLFNLVDVAEVKKYLKILRSK